MEATSKGVRTKKSIVKKANNLFNKEERLLTLEELAHKMELSKSLISNHFPKKELLILAIYKEYEHQLDKLFSSDKLDETKLNFVDLFLFYGDILELFYKYRFSIAYIFINPLKDEALKTHINSRFRNNKERIKNRIENMVHLGLLNDEILEPISFDVFFFKYTNLMTTWIISLSIYDKDKGFRKIKSVYLEGIASCFEPYTTDDGTANYEKAIQAIRTPKNLSTGKL